MASNARTEGLLLHRLFSLFVVFQLVEFGERDLGRLFHFLHDVPANVERGNEDDKHSDKQADQGQDQSNAKLFDVLAEAHRDHGLLFSEEILIVRHGCVPPEQGRMEIARRGEYRERTRGLRRPVPRPEPFRRRRSRASLGRPIERERSY